MRHLDFLSQSIAETIADYRLGDVEAPTAEHVEKWSSQFNAVVQEPLLAELDHVLKRTYLSRDWVSGFLADRVENEKLVGSDAAEFWTRANLLSIQNNGHSQAEMLKLLELGLQDHCGLEIAACGKPHGPYVYLDDFLFSGTRVGNDLARWIADCSPAEATIHVLVIVSHTLGEWRCQERLKRAADAVGKKVSIRFWQEVTVENRRTYRDTSDVLWPTFLPADPSVKAYAADKHRFPFEPRNVRSRFASAVFSSEQGRQLLENAFLVAGCRILAACASPRAEMRPLGFSDYGVGFGSMFATFRNCPNNCPLALWWGDPDAPISSPLSRWYPLLPRKTYAPINDYSEIPW